MDFMHQVEKLLDLPRAEKTRVIAELEAHWNEIVDERTASGMEAVEAAQEAEARLGTPSDIAARLNAVHNSASWKSALLCVVPFAALILVAFASLFNINIYIRLALLGAMSVVMLVGSGRELLRGRRPVWLATWLAGGLMCSASILQYVATFAGLGNFRSYVVFSLLITVLTLAAGLLAHRWQKQIIVVGAFCIACVVWILLCKPGDPNSLTKALYAFYAMHLANMILRVLFARIVFEMHPYGSGTQASLFILSTFLLGFSMHAGWSFAIAALVSKTLGGLAIIWFARVPKRRTKAFASFAALLLSSIFSFVVVNAQHYPLIPSLTYMIFSAILSGIILLIVLWPMRCEQASQNRPTFAS